MNWGTKIIIVYILFVMGIMFLIFKSSNQNIDLVTPDYYAKELVYQNTIEARNRTNALSEQIKVNQLDSFIIIQLPIEMSTKMVKASITLYCPSDKQKDVHFNQGTRNAIINLPISTVAKGYYELQIDWTANEQRYYYEDKLILK